MQHDGPARPSSLVSPDEERQRRERQAARLFMSIWAIVGGLVFVIFLRDWTWNGIWVPYLGYACIALGVMALLGVNVFWGGPLDKRRG